MPMTDLRGNQMNCFRREAAEILGKSVNTDATVVDLETLMMTFDMRRLFFSSKV
jgi:hypothetical protein